MTETNNLLVIENNDPKHLFYDGGLQAVVNEVARRAKYFKPDLTTAKGRAEIASNAAKVSRSKTFLEKMAKEYVAEMKEKIKPVDQARIAMAKELDSLRDEVRAPLTEWENEEAERKAKIEKSLKAVKDFYLVPHGSTAEYIKSQIDRLQKPTSVDWMEYREQYEAARDNSIKMLEDQYARQVQYESDQAELADLRKKQDAAILKAAKKQSEISEKARAVAAQALEASQQAAKSATEREIVNIVESSDQPTIRPMRVRFNGATLIFSPETANKKAREIEKFLFAIGMDSLAVEIETV